MAEDLKSKTKKSLVWSTVDRLGAIVITFVTGIITARLLTPHDFGLIGALAIFSAIGNILIESGFSITLLKRKEISKEEYSAVFFFNIAVGLALYIPFYFCTPLIADFFHEEALTKVARVVFLTLLLNPLAIVQIVLLKRSLNYKIMALANIIGLTASGVGVCLLIKFNYGYWALAWQQIIFIGVKVICLWLLHPFSITTKCNFGVIRELFSSSVKIISNSLLNTTVYNIYNFVIGRKYEMSQLGYFSQARKYEEILPLALGDILGGVGSSALVKLNEDPERQLLYLRRFTKITAFITFPTMAFLFLCMGDVVSLVFTDKWLPMVPFFQLFCFSGTLHPFHTLFYNYYLVSPKGQERALLLESGKNIMILLSVFFCIYFFPNDIQTLIKGYILIHVVLAIIDAVFLKCLINYSPIDLIKDLLPNLLITLVMAISVIQFQNHFQLGTLYQVVAEVAICGIIYLVINLFVNRQLLVELITTFKKKD